MNDFDEWMREVDRQLEADCGCGHADLPDFNWRDYFDDGISATATVGDFLAEDDER